ncbi:MAG: ADP-ribosylglycohydrolase family protein [Christensenellales bacterium]|jgi:ADP-ribosylglycohydrolase
MKDVKKYRGCLLGGAVGDALGYAVEFMQAEEIFRRYGKCGITEYSLVDGVALISDDTQMTLYTANGLLLGTTRGMTRGIFGGYPSYIGSCYRDWLKTQGIRAFGKEAPQVSWLNNVPEMHHRRAPGGTCMGSLSRDTLGSTANPINSSKGCGGVMRVAPIGLYFDASKGFSTDAIDRIGAEAAALTHGHELGYIPAAALVHIVHMVSHNHETLLEDAIIDAIHAMERLFPTAHYLHDFVSIMEKAIALSKREISDLDAIRQLGEGWVAEETLAIAVYCALKHQNSFEKAIVAAVNHGGDSDSTGAVTGNILGAHLGVDAIPQKFLTNLELRDVIEDIANDLFCDCQTDDAIWVSKYITHEYAPK